MCAHTCMCGVCACAHWTGCMWACVFRGQKSTLGGVVRGCPPCLLRQDFPGVEVAGCLDWLVSELPGSSRLGLPALALQVCTTRHPPGFDECALRVGFGSPCGCSWNLLTEPSPHPQDRLLCSSFEKACFLTKKRPLAGKQ